MKCDITDRRVDGGYGFVIVLSSFLLVVITDGTLFSFGNLLIELIGHFNEDRATTAVIGSFLLGISCLTGPIGGTLCDKYGCRIVAVGGAITSCAGLVVSVFATSVTFLYISYGIIGGIGIGSMYLTANVSVLQQFSRFRGLACGITLCGSGAGTFIYNLFTRYLLNTYGWRGTVLIEAGMCLQGAVFGMFLLPPLDEKKRKSEHFLLEDNLDGPQKKTSRSACAVKETADTKKSRSYVWQTVLKNKQLLIFLLSSLVVHLAFSVVIGFTVDSAVESGISKYEASWLASSLGITNIMSRIFIGWVADMKGVSRIVVVCILLLLAGITTALSFLLGSFTTRIIYTSVYGFFIGGYMSICPLVLVDIVSAEGIDKTFGLYLFAIGVSSIIATPVGGLLFDRTNSYDTTFVVAGCELILGGLLAVVVKCIAVAKEKRHQSYKINN